MTRFTWPYDNLALRMVTRKQALAQVIIWAAVSADSFFSPGRKKAKKHIGRVICWIPEKKFTAGRENKNNSNNKCFVYVAAMLVFGVGLYNFSGANVCGWVYVRCIAACTISVAKYTYFECDKINSWLIGWCWLPAIITKTINNKLTIPSNLK